MSFISAPRSGCGTALDCLSVFTIIVLRTATAAVIALEWTSTYPNSVAGDVTTDAAPVRATWELCSLQFRHVFTFSDIFDQSLKELTIKTLFLYSRILAKRNFHSWETHIEMNKKNLLDVHEIKQRVIVVQNIEYSQRLCSAFIDVLCNMVDQLQETKSLYLFSVV